LGYEFKRGETIGLVLEAVQGDPGVVDAIQAIFRPTSGGRIIEPGAPTYEFEVLERETAPAGWDLGYSDELSLQLAPGTYLIEARLEIAGGVVITETADMRIKPTVAAP
jgi:hypothetical protein